MRFSNLNFNLVHTFECGQCFRWKQNDDGSYIGVVKNKVIKAYEDKNEIVLECDDDPFIKDYFDLNRDYSKIKSELSKKDDIMKEGTKLGYGIRLLKQEPWETIISFIISANNNIPRIKKIINSLCENFGECIEYNGYKYYTFPSPEKIGKLSENDLEVIKSGFRSKYILDAANCVLTGKVDMNLIYNMKTDDAREYLKQIKGIGDKVSDCVLLFAYQKYDVFPKDVWIKKALFELYGVSKNDFDGFVTNYFGSLSGFAQQYLFYYMRELTK